MQSLKITVTDTTGIQSTQPVSGGVPLAKGTAPRGSKFVLYGPDNQPILCQTQVLAEWEDGSVRWLLLDFQDRPSASGKAEYILTWGSRTSGITHEVPVEIEPGSNFSISSGNVYISSSDNSLFQFSNKGRVGFVATSDNGELYRGKVESAEIETKGSLRSVLRLSGSFRNDSGKRLFGFHCWITVFAGLSKVLIEPMVLMDSQEGLIHKIRDLNIEFLPQVSMRSARIGGSPDWNGDSSRPVRLFQIDDQQYVFEGAQGKGKKAPGWAEIGSGDDIISVALRDFWQQWPKSIEITPKSLKLGLFPHFKAGTFDHMFDPWYKHDYLFENDCYRLRQGQTRRWQIWLDIEGDGKSLAAIASAPLVPAPDPAQASATTLFGDVLPEGAKGLEEFDEWMRQMFAAYDKSIELQRDYGAMNWGDWWGERGVNWGNHEYDTPRMFFMQYGRTGDPQFYHSGERAARHMSEIDVIHFVNADLVRYIKEDVGQVRKDPNYPVRPGMMHMHTIGHVGGFHPISQIRELYVKLRVGGTDKPFVCLDPYNLGHIFAEGIMYNYFLTGDPWAKVTLQKMGENLTKLVEDGHPNFSGHSHCGRENGWPMLALAACYEFERDQRFLKGMEKLAELALKDQDPVCGGWVYRLSVDHCRCETKHWGEAAFITGVRLNGLYRYYQLTGDERIPEVIHRAVRNMNRDTWNHKEKGWRYTSCPATYPVISQFGTCILACANSIRLSNDQEQLEILRDAWEALFTNLKTSPPQGKSAGKDFSQILYGCSEAVSLLAMKANEGGEES